MQPPTAPPPTAVVTQLLLSSRFAYAIGTAAQLGYADHLASGPKTAAELAELARTDARSVHRLLRALASGGFFVEKEDGRFANTPLSDALREGVPGSLRNMALFVTHPVSAHYWSHLADAVRMGRPSFEQLYGMKFWEYLARTPDYAAIFDGAMTSVTSMLAPAVADAYDFSGIGTLCDVAGGHGHLLGTILAKYPSMRGVLFDQPHVLAAAGKTLEATGSAPRCELVSGDFFVSVPSADAHMLKSILHDWNDEDAIRILKSVQRAGKPGQKLIVVEGVIRPGNQPDPIKVLDLEMLASTQGGRERTEQEFAALFDAAGFDLVRVVPTQAPLSNVIEGRRR